jgi:hypothetical protein
MSRARAAPASCFHALVQLKLVHGPQNTPFMRVIDVFVATCSLIVQQPALAELSPYPLRLLSRGSECGAVVAQDDTHNTPPAVCWSQRVMTCTPT